MGRFSSTHPVTAFLPDRHGAGPSPAAPAASRGEKPLRIGCVACIGRFEIAAAACAPEERRKSPAECAACRNRQEGFAIDDGSRGARPCPGASTHKQRSQDYFATDEPGVKLKFAPGGISTMVRCGWFTRRACGRLAHRPAAGGMAARPRFSKRCFKTAERHFFIPFEAGSLARVEEAPAGR